MEQFVDVYENILINNENKLEKLNIEEFEVKKSAEKIKEIQKGRWEFPVKLGSYYIPTNLPLEYLKVLLL